MCISYDSRRGLLQFEDMMNNASGVDIGIATNTSCIFGCGRLRAVSTFNEGPASRGCARSRPFLIWYVKNTFLI